MWTYSWNLFQVIGVQFSSTSASWFNRWKHSTACITIGQRWYLSMKPACCQNPARSAFVWTMQPGPICFTLLTIHAAQNGEPTCGRYRQHFDPVHKYPFPWVLFILSYYFVFLIPILNQICRILVSRLGQDLSNVSKEFSRTYSMRPRRGDQPQLELSNHIISQFRWVYAVS